MESVLYIKIRHSNNPVKQCPVNSLATCYELFFALASSLICTSYALHHDESFSTLSPARPTTLFPAGYLGFILNPPPALMLVSCITLGCCISSFAYRRQSHDPFQALIFGIAIIVAVGCGWLLNVGRDVVMLGLVPAALCVAMVLCLGVSWGVRNWKRWRGRRVLKIEVRCCELGEAGKAREKDTGENEERGEKERVVES